MTARRRLAPCSEVAEMLKAIQELRAMGVVPDGYGVEVGSDSVKLLPPANHNGDNLDQYINRPSPGPQKGQSR